MKKYDKPRIIEGTKVMEESYMYELLNKSEYGVISTVGKDNIPYGFPMSYIVKDNYIYFHCALEGHKIDNFKYNNNVSFCVVADTKLIPEDLDTAYSSVIVFGKVEEVLGDEKVDILIEIVRKYAEEFLDKGIIEAKRDKDITGIYRISIDKITGKARRI